MVEIKIVQVYLLCNSSAYSFMLVHVIMCGVVLPATHTTLVSPATQLWNPCGVIATASCYTTLVFLWLLHNFGINYQEGCNGNESI